MFTKFVEMLKNKTIRERLAYTLGIFLIFKLGTNITIPLVNVNSYFDQFSDANMLSLLNMMGGGALSQFSIFSLGVSPYITSQIVIQLLAGGVLPSLKNLQESGEKGKKSLENTTRLATLMLGAVQAYGIIVTAQNQGMTVEGTGFWVYAYLVAVMMAGAFFTMWLGDQITAKGVGNGISMIIFAGIVGAIPSHFITAWQIFVNDTSTASIIFTGILKFGLYAILYGVLIVFVCFLERSQRKVPIQYSNSTYTIRSVSDITFLPIKLNSAGVIPVIFSSSVLAAPATILALVNVNTEENAFIKFLNITTPFHGWYTGLMVFIVLNMLFTFFYANMQVDAEKMAENFNKSGAYIPGIRPGKETERYISKVLNRVTLAGAIGISVIAVLPYLIQIIIGQIYTADIASRLASGFGGTGIIIIVGVALETIKELEGRMAGKDYSGFSQESVYY
jgi:preprotein translocase subunit SecY